MDLTEFGSYALNVRTNISSYGPRARLINKSILRDSKVKALKDDLFADA